MLCCASWQVKEPATSKGMPPAAHQQPARPPALAKASFKKQGQDDDMAAEYAAAAAAQKLPPWFKDGPATFSKEVLEPTTRMRCRAY